MHLAVCLFTTLFVTLSACETRRVLFENEAHVWQTTDDMFANVIRAPSPANVFLSPSTDRETRTLVYIEDPATNRLSSRRRDVSEENGVTKHQIRHSRITGRPNPGDAFTVKLVILVLEESIGNDSATTTTWCEYRSSVLHSGTIAEWNINSRV